MRRLTLMILLLALFIIPVSAVEFTAPEVPDAASPYFRNTGNFGDDLWYIAGKMLTQFHPSFVQAAQNCLSMVAIVLLTAIIKPLQNDTDIIIDLVGTVSVSLLFLKSSNTLIQLGVAAISELVEYGKLLLPVMTAAMAAQGGTATSAALNIGTAFFNSILGTLISAILIPMLYTYICLCIAHHAIGVPILKNLHDFLKWLLTWSLKILLYIFMAYMGITNVVSGSVDAATMRAAKLTISGFVPVVGNILSDASEAIIVSAGVMKNTVGVYGVLVLIALFASPFLKIGSQYLLMKFTSAVSNILGNKKLSDLIKDFSGAMGLLLAMTGTVCLLLLISTVCFMKGVS